MRVNSTFTGFFTPDSYRDRLLMGFFLMLTIFFIASSFTKRSDPDLRAKQVNIIIRQIGHRLLLQAGDSTSRVLPVTETRKGTFLLQFENEFIFRHDSLMALTQSLLPKTQFPSGYIVTVHDCIKGAIVYGFQLSNTSPDMLACRGRRQPAGCYTIEFIFPDFYESIEEKKADIEQPTEELKSAKVDPQIASRNPSDSYREAMGTEKLKTTTLEHDIDRLTKELKSVKIAPPETNPIPMAVGTEELKTTTSYPLINLVYSGIVVVFLFVTLLIGRFGKGLVPVPVSVQNQDHSIIKESVPELAALGKFLFDLKEQRLLLGSEVISLTDKECKVLELLHKNFGELIPRETLMEKVWINEGVITGRSLDMFVSKLRKKLSPDPELRITNVHGKGYKLEIPGM